MVFDDCLISMVRKWFCALRQNVKLKGKHKQNPNWEHDTVSLKCLSSVERQKLVISWWNSRAKIIFGLSEAQWTDRCRVRFNVFLSVPWVSWANSPDSPGSLPFSWRGAGAGEGSLLKAPLFSGLPHSGFVLPSTCHSNLSLLRFITWLEHFMHHSTLLQRFVVMVFLVYFFFACLSFLTSSENTRNQVKQIKHVM